MNSSAGIPGGTENAVDSIQPLEPGGPDVIPTPPAISEPGAEDDHIPLPSDDEAPVEEEGATKVERNNSLTPEHPGEI
ncbi:hypothetical protein [Pseudomonas sp. NPDC088444]|uniref:hypothetical protein n=1 Tax=Pseudomonas sp. NPDC088444 TaxID=3364456 RepID=UPI00384DE6F6